MYIIEKLIKLYLKVSGKEISVPHGDENSDEIILEDITKCNHTFLPIDSTGNVLACSKCGYLVDKKKLDKRKINKENA